MRHVWYQQPLPGHSLVSVSASLWLHTTRQGRVTVGWQLEELEGPQLLALGCTPSLTQQDAADVVDDVLRELWVAQQTLLDLPPFP